MNWIEALNDFGRKRLPCAFVIDFKGINAEVMPLHQLENNQIRFAFPGFGQGETISENKPISIEAFPPDRTSYSRVFSQIQHHLQSGDSYLTNLTFSTPVTINADLEQIYLQSKAKYKILFKDEWVCFSPETFVQITDDIIAAFPMKGTIDATLPNAEMLLKENFKEKAEHNTIVDLLRNDLSTSARQVRVEQLMYTEKIKTHYGEILQMSSEIKGNLTPGWQDEIGDLLQKLLPAGSVSGAPKKKTVEIIQAAETHERGFYTGIAGIFNGKNLDSCVLIRFIEKTPQGLVYKSGGGITALSQEDDEYAELISKIYVPVH